MPRRSYAHLPDDQQAKIKSEAERLLKARTFADPQKGYSLSEFHSLIEQCQAGGFVLGPSLIAKLLGVPKGLTRDKLQAAAIRGRWTWSQLSDAIRASGKTKKTHATQGRTVARPKTKGDALSTLYADCVAFRKRAAAIKDAADQIGLTVVVQVGIDAAMKEIMKLEKSVATIPRPGQGQTVRPVDGVRDAVRRLDEQVPGWLAQLDAIARGLGESTTMGVKVIEARDALNDVLKVAHSRQR